jgi:hypothetical protein
MSVARAGCSATGQQAGGAEDSGIPVAAQGQGERASCPGFDPIPPRRRQKCALCRLCGLSPSAHACRERRQALRSRDRSRCAARSVAVGARGDADRLAKHGRAVGLAGQTHGMADLRQRQPRGRPAASGPARFAATALPVRRETGALLADPGCHGADPRYARSASWRRLMPSSPKGASMRPRRTRWCSLRRGPAPVTGTSFTAFFGPCRGTDQPPRIPGWRGPAAGSASRLPSALSEGRIGSVRGED